ncbi:hypothetical protein JMJ55_02600 [Belnapia sp. T6]|uniref:Mandelate racemase/muconate lactonizing enzyme C-terminal domain-containing protein n=1 Tax=Belnapia mucosa TaxID=2804532 RepID=A0ABS1UXL6_9PROT|nr:enolase C-terminal domain-like protein [Belnapia mucosa]MBL6454196.1 hypothetical protein [Belnapia mucosa]
MPASLRLAAVEPWPLALPLRHPMRLASETVAVAETLLVRIMDEDGQEGWGEASSAPTMTGELLPGMAAAVARFLGPALLAAPIAGPEEGARRLHRAIRGNAGAKSAVETALLDLIARRAGLPLSALLGGARRDAVPAIRMVGEADPAATLAAVGAAAGFSHVKLKLGMGASPEADVALCIAARARLGAGAHLSGDVNMAWTREEALRFLTALPSGTLDYLEQPVADDDLDGMAAAVAAGACPICVDEGLHGMADIATHAARRAADGLGLKAIKLGGLQALMVADALARRQGLRTTLACKIAESGIGAAAMAHAAAAVEEVGWGVSLTHGLLAEDAVAVSPRLVGGQWQVPPGPGHGAMPDRARLDRYRWRAGD